MIWWVVRACVSISYWSDIIFGGFFHIWQMSHSCFVNNTNLWTMNHTDNDSVGTVNSVNLNKLHICTPYRQPTTHATPAHDDTIELPEIFGSTLFTTIELCKIDRMRDKCVFVAGNCASGENLWKIGNCIKITCLTTTLNILCAYIAYVFSAARRWGPQL